MHAHDETEVMLPEYYKLFIDHVLENGFVFEKPTFYGESRLDVSNGTKNNSYAVC